MNYETIYRIFPLGDAALTIDFGNYIDEALNRKVISFFDILKKRPIEGMIEAVPAYSSVTVHYDVMKIKGSHPFLSASDFMKKKLDEIMKQSMADNQAATAHIRIPVYYDGPDLEFISKEKKLSVGEIIQIHCAITYRVYMLGFLPGFAYMGQVDERIEIARKKQPRVKVPAGSVGIAGRQTGIYPADSPGGWQLIGRTPLSLFDASKETPALLQAGNTVEFYPITANEFENY